MSQTRVQVGWVVAMAIALSLEPGAIVSGQRGAEVLGQRAPRNAEEFDKMFQQLSNAGRWGTADTLGTLNLITPAKRRQAIALAKNGTSVSLAHTPLTEPAVDNPTPWQHVMSASGTSDTHSFNYHGYAQTHVDALCHMLYKDKAYNGFSRSDINPDGKGCARLGIDVLKEGIITRAVLIDVPRLKGLPYLEPSTPVVTEDLEAWEKKVGVKVSAGDAIFVRTGRWARRAARGAWAMGQSGPGYHASVAPWMKARDVALIGSDTTNDVHPTGVEGMSIPVHLLFIAGLGAHLFDNLDLEDVANTAERLGRWEFMLVVAPIPVKGGTGMPVNPIAVF